MSELVLVASDGSPASLGALRVARALSETRGVRVAVLAVVEPVPLFDAGFMVAVPEAELYESRQQALLREVQGQIEEVGAAHQGWDVMTTTGAPGAQIVKEAQGKGADWIFLGLGRHGPMDRIFGTETALQVVRLSHLPVLAVPGAWQDLPRSAVVGADFSSFSRRAARAAAALLADPGKLHLVHVLSGMEVLPTMSEQWRVEYEEEVRERLEEWADDPALGGRERVEIHVLEGEPARELLAFAETHDAEMLVAGSHGLSFVGRLLMGSVSTRLIRGAQVPVLVFPPREMAEEVVASAPPRRAEHPWVKELREFSLSNTGRRATLEIHDPALGAQTCGKGLRLRGVDYDPKQDRVSIMMGRLGSVEGHLTHSLADPQDIQWVRSPESREEVLRVQLSAGQAILRVHRD